MNELELEAHESKIKRADSLSLSLNINTIATTIVALGVMAMVGMMINTNQRLIALESKMTEIVKSQEWRMERIESTVYGAPQKVYSPKP